jgi:hypothetical protein
VATLERLSGLNSDSEPLQWSSTNATNYVFVFLFEQTAAFDHGQLKVNFSGRHPFYEVHQPHAGLLAQRWKPTGFRFNGSRNSLVEPFVDTCCQRVPRP